MAADSEGEGAVPRQLTVVAGLLTIGLVAFGYERLVGGLFVGLFLGCVLATVLVYLVAHADDKLASAIVFGLFAVAALVMVVVRQFRALGWPAALAIDVAVVAAGWAAIWYAAFGHRRIADARLLRRAAERLGWRSRPVDADLLRRVRVLFLRVRNPAAGAAPRHRGHCGRCAADAGDRPVRRAGLAVPPAVRAAAARGDGS
jgi:hypothetical protein